MGLNISSGNMYDWITHTWNTVKGVCPHGCTYCYMHRFPQKPVRFDEAELVTYLGENNFIFVGSSCDMWANSIPVEWIVDTLNHCNKYPENKYLFQTKNPENIRRILCQNSHVCVTLETNRFYPDVMRNCPTPVERVKHMRLIRHPLYITIEPIMDFDLLPFVEMIKSCSPVQVNIGSDSGHNHLSEPPKEKVLELIDKLSKFTIIANKRNLKRLL
jgi:protein gp37